MLDDEHRIRVALELNALHSTGAIGDALEAARIGTGTPIYDLNGELLYERIPLSGRRGAGYADIAFHPAMGGVLMAVSHGSKWDANAILKEARTELARQGGEVGRPKPDAMRFVAFCYPKLAVQFLAGDQEIAMLEWKTWRQVPRGRQRMPGELPTFFERSSFLDSQTDEARARRRRRFKRRADELLTIPNRHEVSHDRVAVRPFADHVGVKPPEEVLDRREVHFSRHSIDHHVCYERQGQRNSHWCVAASVKMLLDFYRYEYTQDQLAAKLGLGTNRKPAELADFHAAKICDVVKSLSGNALEVTMKRNPTWTDFRREIAANRPVVAFLPGHARTIAGYTETRPLPHHLSTSRGYLVYDPSPPTTGVTLWESIDVHIYTVAFMARLVHA